MPKKKKITKRSQAKYPALDKTYNLKSRSDLYDFDYINGYHDEETGSSIRPLNDKEKEWLNSFVSEYVNSEFNPNKKRIHKKKKTSHPKNNQLKKLTGILLNHIKEMNNEIKKSNIGLSSEKNLRRLLFKFKKQLANKIKNEYKFIADFYKKDAYDSNNARNRCILTRAKASGKYNSLDEMQENSYIIENSEDMLIDQLDLARQLQNTKNNTEDS